MKLSNLVLVSLLLLANWNFWSKSEIKKADAEPVRQDYRYLGPDKKYEDSDDLKPSPKSTTMTFVPDKEDLKSPELSNVTRSCPCPKPQNRSGKTSVCPCKDRPCLCVQPDVPVKVRCEPRNGRKTEKEEPCCRELRYLKESELKRKEKTGPKKVQGVCKGEDKKLSECSGPSAMECSTKGSRNGKEPVTICTECEECELQVKANGDGVLVRCKKCQRVNPGDVAFPHGKAHRIVKLP